MRPSLVLQLLPRLHRDLIICAVVLGRGRPTIIGLATTAKQYLLRSVH